MQKGENMKESIICPNCGENLSACIDKYTTSYSCSCGYLKLSNEKGTTSPKMIKILSKNERIKLLSGMMQENKRDPKEFDLESFAIATEGFNELEIRYATYDVFFFAINPTPSGYKQDTTISIEQIKKWHDLRKNLKLTFAE